MVNRIASSNGKTMTPEHLVNGCLDMVGPMEVEEDTRKELVSLAETGGSMDLSTEAGYQDFSNRVTEVFGMIAGTREYQFG